MLAELVQVIAEGIGFQVHLADSAAGISAGLDAISPKIILMDLNLPGVQTDEILTILADSNRETPIFVTSGEDPCAVDAVIEKGRRIGLRMRGSIAKPFDISKLEATLEEFGR